MRHRFRLVFLGGGEPQPWLGLHSDLEIAMALARDWHRATFNKFMAIVDYAPERPEAGRKDTIIGYRHDHYTGEFKPIREERKGGWTGVAAMQAVKEHLEADFAATQCAPHVAKLIQRNVLAPRTQPVGACA